MGTSTPNKGPAPASGDLNGKKVDEKPITDDTTKINGDVEKVTNGDAKKEEVVEEEETKAETEEEPTKETDETVEEATSEKKKTSTKDKIKKRLSIRSINFLKRKKKEDK